jgi:hypothetical protein
MGDGDFNLAELKHRSVGDKDGRPLTLALSPKGEGT